MYRSFGRPEKSGSRFRFSLWIVTASSLRMPVKLSPGMLRRLRSTMKISTRLLSRSFSQPFERRSSPLCRSISRRMLSGANIRPGSEGKKLFSRMSSSIGRMMDFETAFSPIKTRGRSLCEHLRMGGNGFEIKLLSSASIASEAAVSYHICTSLPRCEHRQATAVPVEAKAKPSQKKHPGQGTDSAFLMQQPFVPGPGVPFDLRPPRCRSERTSTIIVQDQAKILCQPCLAATGSNQGP
uniref:Uncharacterized protein n=1 Tax=Anopheles farauti TaxID=69004 RepID=A0A182QBI5_9DIPT